MLPTSLLRASSSQPITVVLEHSGCKWTAWEDVFAATHIDTVVVLVVVAVTRSSGVH